MIRFTLTRGFDMYLGAERLAIVNRTVQETFEQTSVAWQTIPHWKTPDPGQSTVRPDSGTEPGAALVELRPIRVDFDVTLAQVLAPTVDALLATVMRKIVELAKLVDDAVVGAILAKAGAAYPPLGGDSSQNVLTALIDARAAVEDAGYRAPSCLLVNTAGLQRLSVLEGGYPVTDALLTAANVNALHRVTMTETKGTKTSPIPALRIVMLGRRQRIARGGAADASPGEEPVDLAVSVAPSLEVVGDTPEGKVALAVRTTLATRVKDTGALVVITE